ncbi:MAG: hypothetical protein E7592_00610 [Ruminococcaceae bacterium]|nr:hypothetical protein [Oscillospiraceae bacterium]
MLVIRGGLLGSIFATGCGIITTGCGIITTGCGIITTGCGIITAGCGIVTAGCGIVFAGYDISPNLCGSRGLFILVRLVFARSKADRQHQGKHHAYNDSYESP